MHKCFICMTGIEEKNISENRTAMLYEVTCEVCGSYIIAQVERERRWLLEDKEKLHILSGLARQNKERGLPPLEITLGNIKELLSATNKPDVHGQLDRIILWLFSQTKQLGEFISVRERTDYPVAFAKNAVEFLYMLEILEKQGFIERKPQPKESVSSFRLTIEGHKRADELRPRTATGGRQCFVAMWFDESMNPVWEKGIEPAIKRAGYDPIRIDKVAHNQKICDQIVVEIRRSRLIVADVTGQRGGVYFEAGFAMGLGIPVIWTVREDEMKNVHFDTNHYNHICWKDEADLYQKLRDRIEATVPLPPTTR